MTFVALAFAAGVIALQRQAELPPLAWAWALAVLAAAAVRWRFARIALAFGVGFAWAAWCAHGRLDAWLDPALEGRDIGIVGVVSSLPIRNERGVRFDFDVEAAPAGERLPGKVLLSWYAEPGFDETAAAAPAPPSVHPGDRWRLTVRLRRPHGQVNPHGFDYEAWLLERGIGATGYVRIDGAAPERIGWRNTLLDRVEQARETIRARFDAALGERPAAGILAALAVGDQHAIAQEEWLLFGRTGVTHLMSISGLHVTLVSGLAAWLLAALWRRVPRLALRLPARKAAAAVAVIAALGYALLAGFAVPAQRTFYMVSMVALALWFGHLASPGRTLALALATVLLADPWAPLAPGFWLSFGAVALIFYVASGWTRRDGRVLQWARIQWAITLGLAPAALLLFGQISLAGPLANALAIPLVSGVITPLALMAAVIPVQPLFELGAWLVEWLLQFLEWCAALPSALWQQHVPPLWAVLLALAGTAWMLAPRGVPGRVFGLALMAPAFALPPPQPAPGEVWITTFDVGQGLAVLVRTATRALVYDTGPSYGPDTDAGGRVIVPALRAAGVAALDLMVLSHEDSDHVGGALGVMESVPVAALVSSLPAGHALHAFAPSSTRCIAGARWEWDDVTFEILHPPADAPAAPSNDRSCVLRVHSAGGAVLLTGDIERTSEASLARQPLHADVLVVPHHGSRTSSTAPFIAAVAPRWAVVPVGYRNRFRHPNAAVLERYRAAGAQVLRTDIQGAVHVTLGAHGVRVDTERAREPRYWRGAPRV